MTMTWTTNVRRMVWRSSTDPLITWAVRTGAGATTGAGGQLPESGTAGQVPQVAAGGASYELKTPNTPDGLLRLGPDGLVADIHLRENIVRTSEMESAIAAAIDDLVNGAPGALDTLNELAAALDDDENFAATVTAALAAKASTAQLADAVAAVAPLTVAAMHFTNINLSLPHPFGAGLLPGLTIELVGQWDPDENGTYTVPAAPTVDPLEPADTQLLSFGNLARQVSVLLAVQGSLFYGPLELIVILQDNAPTFVPQSGTTLFVDRRVGHALGEQPGDVVVDFDGALSPGALVLVAEQESGSSYNVRQFVADGQTLARSRVQCSAGSTVRTFDGEQWLLTPDSGWARVSISAPDVIIPTASLTGLFAGIDPNVAMLARQFEGIADVHRWISAYSDTNVNIALYSDPDDPPVAQPTLSDGTVPEPGTDIALIGQSTPGDVVLHHVEADGHWTPVLFPDVLYGNGFQFHLCAPGDPAHDLIIEWIDNNPTVRQRRSFPWPGSAFGTSDASGGTWHKRYPHAYLQALLDALDSRITTLEGA